MAADLRLRLQNRTRDLYLSLPPERRQVMRTNIETGRMGGGMIYDRQSDSCCLVGTILTREDQLRFAGRGTLHPVELQSRGLSSDVYLYDRASGAWDSAVDHLGIDEARQIVLDTIKEIEARENPADERGGDPQGAEGPQPLDPSGPAR